MGGSETKSQFDEEDWRTVALVGQRVLLENNSSGDRIEMHQSHQANEYQSQEIFEWRKQLQGSGNIVQVYHYRINSQLFGAENYTVFTQVIHRLGDMPTLSKAEGLLLMRDVLVSLIILFRRFGFFNLSVRTIGVDEHGVGKMWLNQNFAKNYPEQSNELQQNSVNEELLIVNNLVRMIRQKVYDNKLSMDYPHSMNFVDTIQYIDECRNHRELLIDKVYIDREKFRVAYTAILNTQASESNQEAREINGGESCLEIPLQTISRNVSNGPQVGEEKHTLGNEQRENGQMPHRQVANLQTRQIDTVQMMQIDNMQMRQVDNPGSHYPVNGGQLQQIFGGQPQPQSINLGQAPHRYPPILQEHVGRPEYPQRFRQTALRQSQPQQGYYKQQQIPANRYFQQPGPNQRQPMHKPSTMSELHTAGNNSSKTLQKSSSSKQINMPSMHSPPRQAYRMPINPQLGQMIQNPRQTMLQTGTQYPTNYNINQAQPNPVIPQLRHITPARQRNSSPIHLHSHTTMQTQNAMTDFYNNQTAVNDRIIKPLFRNQVTINNGMPPLPLQMPKQIPTYAYSGDLNQLPWNIAHNIEQELEQGHHTQQTEENDFKPCVELVESMIYMKQR